MFAKALTWFRSTLEGAGLARWGLSGLFWRVVAVAVVLGVWSFLVSRILALGVCIGILTAALAIEVLHGKAKARRREVATIWPEVLDSLASAELAAINLIEAFSDLAEHAPDRLRPHFVRANAKLLAGFSFDRTMLELKAEFGEPHADRLIELLRMVNEIGATGYHELLRAQSRSLRADIALWGAIETKQSWVLGTAKLAIGAPWLIVALLASRPENAAVYNSTGGATLLLIGLLVSAFAYYLIHLLGSLPEGKRVLQ
jgi:tight adherence protein B